ncbi:MAG TPA: hypothetical protein VF859_09215 [Burkholderiales bacterium]
MKNPVIALFLIGSLGAAHAAGPDAPAPGNVERPTLSIAVAAQNGTAFRLVYTAGRGWSFADHSGPRLASALPQGGPTGPIPAPPAEAPQNVLVDGPTGYVFVYLMDEGWRFVGNVADTRR